MDVAKLKARWKRALTLREPWESGYQECYDYALPGRTSFFRNNPEQDAPEIFDETAVIATQEFASRIQAGLVPNYAQWIKLEAGSEVPAELRGQVNTELEAITQIFFEYVNASNFGQEVNESLIDIALGTAVLECAEGSSIQPLVFGAAPLPEIALEPGPNDEIGGYFRARKMPISRIEQSYGVKVPQKSRDLAASQQSGPGNSDDPKMTVVLAVFRDYDRENEYAYKRYVFLPEDEDGGLLKADELNGRGSCPMIGYRWSKVAGEVWGRGPLYNMMPAVRVANLVTQMTLENAELAIAGLYTYEDDGVLNPDNVLLRPGTMVPVAPGSSGVRQINTASNFNVGDLILTRLQENIRKGMYSETLGPMNKTPMSATEVAQRMADLSRQIGSAFGRLQVEMVNPVVNRVLYILERKGVLKRPQINGRAVKIVATSPLSQAQAVEQINATGNWLAMLLQYFGPEAINLYADGAQVAKYAQEQLGVPERLYRTDEARAKMVQDMATAQMGGMSGEGTGQGPATPFG